MHAYEVRDTAKYRPLMHWVNDKRVSQKLSALARSELGACIQSGEHKPDEDARAGCTSTICTAAPGKQALDAVLRSSATICMRFRRTYAQQRYDLRAFPTDVCSAAFTVSVSYM